MPSGIVCFRKGIKLARCSFLFLLTYPHTQLEEVPFEDLNEDQRRKVERKEDVLEEISRLTKRVRKEDFMYVLYGGR